MFTYHFKKPDEISNIDYLQLVELIFNAGENTKENILPNLQNAMEIAFVKRGNEIISTASIIKQSKEILKSKFNRAGMLYLADAFELEWAYCATKIEYQKKGHFSVISNYLLEKWKDNILYCTTSNLTFLDFLQNKYNFKIVGNTFTSKVSKRNYHLLIKE